MLKNSTKRFSYNFNSNKEIISRPTQQACRRPSYGLRGTSVLVQASLGSRQDGGDVRKTVTTEAKWFLTTDFKII